MTTTASALGLMAVACACSTATDRFEDRCGASAGELAARAFAAAAWDAWPAPRVTERAGPDGARTVFVDPAPLDRGEHDHLTYTFAEASCEPVEGVSPAGPYPAAFKPGVTTIGGDTHAFPRLRATVLTALDEGADADASGWSDAFEALRIPGERVHAPSFDEALGAIRRLCGPLDRGGTAIFIVTGRGTATGRGALVLNAAEAISYERLQLELEARCVHAGAIVWVVDASYAAAADAEAFGAIPALVVRASDEGVVDAARASVGGGGLLSRVLSQLLADRARALCFDVDVRPTPADVLGLFPRDDALLRAAMLAQRWDALGASLVDASIASGEAPWRAEARVAARLGDNVVHAPITVGRREGAAGCDGDADCAAHAEACPPAACHALRCVAGACVEAPTDAGGPCDDGSSCTRDDRCDALGFCVGEPVRCQPQGPCTIVGCEPDSGCVALPAPPGGACDDGSVCTGEDSCDGSGRCVGAEIVCDDGDPCTEDFCDPELGCVSRQATLPCDDGDLCTHSDACRDGVCVGVGTLCDDQDACTLDVCDPITGGCQAYPLVDGAPCDDRDACTVADRCFAGICDGARTTCDDGLACTHDTCDAGRCRHLPIPGFCVFDDYCVTVGSSPDGAECLRCEATDRLVPVADGAACPDDGITCTADRCDAGECVHVDAPDMCHDADGRCVVAGELVTPCLRCEGGGVVTRVDEGAACSGAAAP